MTFEIEIPIEVSENIRQKLSSLSLLHSLYWFTEDFDKTDAVNEQIRPLLAALAEQDVIMWKESAQLDAERAHIAFSRGEDASVSERLIVSAYQMARQHVDEKDTDSMQDYSKILSVIVMAYESVGWLEQEDSYLKEYIRIYETLYGNNPRAYAKLLFEGYNNLADNLIVLKNLAEAKSFIDKAMQILPELERGYGSSVDVNLMVFYDTVANYYEQQGDVANCREYAVRCMSYYEKMPAELQEVYQEVKEHWTK